MRKFLIVPIVVGVAAILPLGGSAAAHGHHDGDGHPGIHFGHRDRDDHPHFFGVRRFGGFVHPGWVARRHRVWRDGWPHRHHHFPFYMLRLFLSGLPR